MGHNRYGQALKGLGAPLGKCKRWTALRVKGKMDWEKGALGWPYMVTYNFACDEYEIRSQLGSNSYTLNIA